MLLLAVFYLSVSSVVIAQEKCDNINEFLCRDGKCILKEFLCDGSRECVDGSDETQDLCLSRGCSQSLDYVEGDPFDIFSIPNLNRGQVFKCKYGACIPQKFVCDGIQHCVADGSDETEELCEKIKCERRQFRCNYGGCIEKNNACDNRFHCFDRSDESAEVCKKTRKICLSRTKFACDYGACIQKKQKCDGVINCLDGSDESEATCGSRPSITITSSFPSNVRLIGEPEHPPSQTPSPTVTDPIYIDENRNGCVLRTDPTVEVIIHQCGDQSNCFSEIIPAGTLIGIYCEVGSQLLLECQTDKKWHFRSDPSKAPLIHLCQESTSHDTTLQPPSTSVIIPKNDIPNDCGSLPFFKSPPWMVGLFREENFACTGTIIAPSLVLTAGHCVVSPKSGTTKMNKNDLKIQYRADQHPRDFASVSLIQIHPNYSGGTAPTFDMALLFLGEKIDKSSACIDDQGKLLGLTAWTFNRTFGQTEYKWQPFQQTFNTECVNRARGCTRHLSIGNNQFCSGNEGSDLHLHQGSSGGPYFITKTLNGQEKWTIAGVLSNKIETSDCGTPHTVFTSVNLLRSWIINCGFNGNCNV